MISFMSQTKTLSESHQTLTTPRARRALESVLFRLRGMEGMRWGKRPLSQAAILSRALAIPPAIGSALLYST
jgi:hypothetical protein